MTVSDVIDIYGREATKEDFRMAAMRLFEETHLETRRDRSFTRTPGIRLASYTNVSFARDLEIGLPHPFACLNLQHDRCCPIPW